MIAKTAGTKGEINVYTVNRAQFEKLHDGLVECFPGATVRTVLSPRDAIGKVEGWDVSDVVNVMAAFEVYVTPPTTVVPAQEEAPQITHAEALACADAFGDDWLREVLAAYFTSQEG